MLPSPVHPESWTPEPRVLSPESTGSRLICVPPAQRKLQAKPGVFGVSKEEEEEVKGVQDADRD